MLVVTHHKPLFSPALSLMDLACCWVLLVIHPLLLLVVIPKTFLPLANRRLTLVISHTRMDLPFCFSLLVGPSCWYLPLSWTMNWLLVIVGQHPLSQDYPKWLLITNHYIDGFLALWACYLDRLGVIKYSLLSFFCHVGLSFSCHTCIGVSFLCHFSCHFKWQTQDKSHKKMTINHDKKRDKDLDIDKKRLKEDNPNKPIPHDKSKWQINDKIMTN